MEENNKKLSKEQWEKAVEAYKNGLSLRKCCKTYNIKCKESIRLRVLGQISLDSVHGEKRKYLTDGDEKGILEVIEYRAKRGMCITNGELRYIIRQDSLFHVTHEGTSNIPDKRKHQKCI